MSSQIAPNTAPEPVSNTPRKAMTAARRFRILAKSDGHCAYPECAETHGLEIDHMIALALGGKDDDSNLTALCGPHHAQKTRLDIKLIAKAKRIEIKHTKPKAEWPKTQPIRSAGFRRRWDV